MLSHTPPTSEHRLPVIVQALRRLEQHNCGMRHDQDWREARFTPQGLCADATRENRLGCAHSSQLTLAAAITYAAELQLLSSDQARTCRALLSVAKDNLWAIDIEAQELATIIRRQSQGTLSAPDRQRIEQYERALLNNEHFAPPQLEKALENQQQSAAEPLNHLRAFLLRLLNSAMAGAQLGAEDVAEFMAWASTLVDRNSNRS